MGSLIHIAEVATLLFVAYVAGWLIGYVARRVVARAPAAAAIPAGRLAAAMGESQPEDALVKAPVLVPVHDAPPPVPALATPLEPVTARVGPEGAVIVEAKPAAELVSGLDTLKSLAATMPLLPSDAAPAMDAEAAPQPTLTEPIAAPPPMADSAPEAPLATPANAPGVAWSGSINGHLAARFEAPHPARPKMDDVAVEQVPPEQDEPAATPASVLRQAQDEGPRPQDEGSRDQDESGLDVALLASIAQELNQDLAREDLTEATPEIAPVEQPVASQPAVRVEFDESAAMRAIEGGWSRRVGRALPDAPELTDVSAAVSAAQMAVEQVLARNGLEAGESQTHAQAAFGKPVGLPRPRDAGRDDLKQINGLGPLDESTLNNLGIFHFDQIGGWDEREVLWMENHAFARGRIGREGWQAQARELARGRDGLRAAR